MGNCYNLIQDDIMVIIDYIDPINRLTIEINIKILIFKASVESFTKSSFM